MTPPTVRRPSPDALTRRAERADRQAAFARAAGWSDVARLYEKLADVLRGLLEPER